MKLKLLMTREKLVFKVLMGKLVVSMALTLLCMGLSWRQRGSYLLSQSLGEVSCGRSWNYPPHYFTDLVSAGAFVPTTTRVFVALDHWTPMHVEPE